MTAPATPKFRVTRLREGYDMADVDTFLVDIAPWMAARLPNQEAADRIRAARFKPVRLRPGYAMDDVDDHLDGLAMLASQGLPPV